MALTCEICASTDFLKQDGLFVCQQCGMKYTPQDIQNMIPANTIQMYNAAQLQNNLENARQARQAKDWKRAELFYLQAASLDPSNLEAAVYSAFCQLMFAVMTAPFAQRETAAGVFIRTVSSRYAAFDPDNADLLLNFTKGLGADLLMLFEAPLTHNRMRKTHGGALIKDLPKTDGLFVNLAQQFYQVLLSFRNRTGRRDISEYLLSFTVSLHSTAKNIFSERMTFVANKMLLAERQLVFSRYPDVRGSYIKRMEKITSDIQRYQNDLRDFPSYEALGKANREVSNLSRFLEEKNLTPLQKEVMKEQIYNTRGRCVSIQNQLFAERNSRVAALQEDLRSIQYLLSIR